MNIISLLDMVADTLGDRVASGPLADDFTYQRLFEDVGAFVGRIRQSESEYLLVCDENSRALHTALFAAAWAGVTYVPLNYRLTDKELRSLVNGTTPGLAVVGPGNTDRIMPSETTGDTISKQLTVVERTEITTTPNDAKAARPARSQRKVERTGTTTTPNDDRKPAKPGDWSADPDTVAVLLHTSGTSGPPKSALLRHKHLMSYVVGNKKFASASIDETHLLAVPPYHIASISAQLSQVYAGRRMVTLPRFNADAWIDLVKTENVTHVMLVPTMMARIVTTLENRAEKLLSIRFVSYGGGKPHHNIVTRALSLFPNADFFHAYGLTETSSTVALLGPDDHRMVLAGDDIAKKRLSSVGHPLPTLEVSIRDSDGFETAPGCAGEICVRGDQVSGEYRETGSRLDPEGWFKTHDVGYFDHDGYLYLLGRNDDIIIRGGENISPREVEEALLSHPCVTDAAAFGVDDLEWGEEIAAAIVTTPPEPTVNELRQLVKSRLRSSRVPSHFLFVEKLPYNKTGKLLRRVLKERYKSEVAETRR